MTRRPSQQHQRSGVPDKKRERDKKAFKAVKDLTALPSRSYTELKDQWIETFGTFPPKGLSRRLLVHALAYDLQEQNSGRLKTAVRQRLRQIAAPNPSNSATESLQLSTGTRLMREWRGTVHVVDVTEDGLVWNGRVYASLSAIARTITGTRWSGQRFFGLRKRSDAVDKTQTGRAEVSDHIAPQAAGPQPNKGHCSGELDSSLQPTDTDTKSDASRHPDNVGTEHTARLADSSTHAPSQVCSKLEPESIS